MVMKNIMNAIFAAAAIFSVSCASAPEVKKAPEPVQPVAVKAPAPAVNGDAFVAGQNSQLEKVSVQGFARGKAAVPSREWDTWAESAAPVIKEILNSLPDGYALQVTGHTDSLGSEGVTRNVYIGNRNLSIRRAQAVVASLKKQGISSKRILAAGAGSAEPLEGVAPDDSRQRRVSFKLIKVR